MAALVLALAVPGADSAQAALTTGKYPVGEVDRTGGSTADIAIAAGEILTTLAGTDHAATTDVSYKSVTIAGGGIWRPVEWTNGTMGMATGALANRNINLATLTLNNGMVDLAYAYAYAFSAADPSNAQDILTLGKTPKGRMLRVTDAELNGDNVFRINSRLSLNTQPALNYVSAVFIDNATGGGNIYIQLAHDPEVASRLSGIGGEYVREENDPKYTVLIFTDTGDAGNFNVTGQTSKMDGALSVYEIDPYIEWDQAAGKAYLLGFATFDTGLINETGKMAIDNQLAYRNLWRIEESNIFWRPNALRRLQASGDRADGAGGEESVWATAYRGKLTGASLPGRRIGQTYNGVMVGLDKPRAGDFYNGTLYQGFFLSKMTGNASFAAGRGDQESVGIGVSHTWLGNSGHYLDLLARVQKIEGGYRYLDGNGVAKEASLDNWSYGLSAQYGYRKNFADGLYLEPQAGFSCGKIAGRSYRTHEAPRHTFGSDTLWGDPTNYLDISQGSVDSITGRAGFLLGKNFGGEDKPGEVYLRATLWKEFGNTGEVSGHYSSQSRVFKDKNSPKDTWVELNLGANLKMSPNADFFAQVGKTFGGDVKTDWQALGGFSWRWGGGSPGKAIAAAGGRGRLPLTAEEIRTDNNLEANSKSPELVENQTAAAIPGPAADNASQNSGVPRQAGQPDANDTVRPPAANDTVQPAAANDIAQQPQANNTARTVWETGHNEYALAPVTVEARRPDWERKLSPGTVSVVYPEDFKGEQKTLPEYLETVPGVHIHRLQGTGKYSVARVRGATAAQVGIYIDGVRMNLDSEAAFDLSTIPTDNVARIEVYRGYVPARFAGAPMGGVINIVTKKPAKLGGSLSQGFRSVGGGKKTNLEFTAPLGSGSLLAAWNWEQDDADFKYHHYAAERYNQNPTFPSDVYPADRHRLNNGFQRSDYLFKWQDEHWLAKVQHRNNFTRSGMSTFSNYTSNISTDNPNFWGTQIYGELDIDQTDFLLGRRQTAGNLEWGLQMEYARQKKRFVRRGPAPIYTFPGWLWGNYDTDRYGVAADGTWKLGASHLLEFYFGYGKEDYKVDLSVGDKNWNNMNQARGGSYFSNTRWHFQLQDTIALDNSKTLFLTPVFKMDKADMGALMSRQEENENQWKRSLGVGLKKELGDAWTFKSSWGRYNRYPNFYEIFGDGYLLNPAGTYKTYDLTWETGTNMDISASWRGRAMGSDADFTLTYFRNIFRDMIELNQSIMGASWYNNGGDGWAKGAELEGKMRWPRLDLNFAVTYTDSRKTKYNQFRQELESSQVGLRLFNIPRWEGNIRLTYRLPGDRLAVFAENHYTGKTLVWGVLPTRLGEHEVPENYRRWNESLNLVNLGLKYKINQNASLDLGVNDVFDKGSDLGTYRVNYDNSGMSTDKINVEYPLQGRTYYATMRYSF